MTVLGRGLSSFVKIKNMTRRKLLVHLHLFYTAQSDYFIEKLSHITGCYWTLFLTMPESRPETEEKFRKMHDDVRIIYTENCGYDIWPFISIIKSVNLDEWDYILKLHSKNSQNCACVNGLRYSGYQWRDKAVDTFVRNSSAFANALRMLERPDTGMICNRLFYKKTSIGLPEDLSTLENELQRLGIFSKDRHFCAGSMFMAKASPFKVLQTDMIGCETFRGELQSHICGTMAHAYERILSIAVTASGLHIAPVVTDRLRSMYIDIAVDILQPAFEQIFSLRRIGDRRIKTLTLFGINIPLE